MQIINDRAQVNSLQVSRVEAVDYSGGDVVFDIPRMFLVTVAGDLSIKVGNNTVTLPSLTAGSYHPIWVDEIVQAGSTATIVSLW